MKYENFLMHNSLEADYLTINFDNTYYPDMVAQNMIQEDCPDFLVPMKVLNQNNKMSFRYKIEVSHVLSDTRFRIPKKVFISLFINVIKPFVCGKDWLLDYHNLCVNPEYVFVNPEDYMVQYVYIPETTMSNTDVEINQYFGNVVDNIEITDDVNFHKQLSEYFRRNHVVLIEVYRMLLKEQEKNQKRIVSVKESMKLPTDSAMVVKEEIRMSSDQPKQEKEKEPIPDIIKYDQSEEDIMQALFGTGKKESSKREINNLLSHIRKKDNKEDKQQNNKNDIKENKIKINDIKEQSQEVVEKKERKKTGVTEIFLDNPIVSESYLQLVSSSIAGAPQRIPLDFNGSSILIGRISSDERKPDIVFSPDFKRIGRKHAMLERKNMDIYIIDLGSANHTLLNGRVMEPNHPYRLKNRDEISFTDSMPVCYKTVM